MIAIYTPHNPIDFGPWRGIFCLCSFESSVRKETLFFRIKNAKWSAFWTNIHAILIWFNEIFIDEIFPTIVILLWTRNKNKINPKICIQILRLAELYERFVLKCVIFQTDDLLYDIAFSHFLFHFDENRQTVDLIRHYYVFISGIKTNGSVTHVWRLWICVLCVALSFFRLIKPRKILSCTHALSSSSGSPKNHPMPIHTYIYNMCIVYKYIHIHMFRRITHFYQAHALVDFGTFCCTLPVAALCQSSCVDFLERDLGFVMSTRMAKSSFPWLCLLSADFLADDGGFFREIGWWIKLKSAAHHKFAPSNITLSAKSLIRPQIRRHAN